MQKTLCLAPRTPKIILIPYLGKAFWMKPLTSFSGDDLASKWLGTPVASWEFLLVAWLAHISMTKSNVGSSEALAARRTRKTIWMKLLIANNCNFGPYRLEAPCAFWKPIVIAGCTHLLLLVHEMFSRD